MKAGCEGWEKARWYDEREYFANELKNLADTFDRTPRQDGCIQITDDYATTIAQGLRRVSELLGLGVSDAAQSKDAQSVSKAKSDYLAR